MSTRAFSAISFLLALAPFAHSGDAAPKIYSVNELPAEFRGNRIEATVELPLFKLRQDPKTDHRVGPGDVLGVMVENVIGDDNVRTSGVPSPPVDPSFRSRGQWILVRDDGSIRLPYISRLDVNGLTLVQVEKAIREAYSGMPKILKSGNERIAVELIGPRKCHIIVMRTDVERASRESGPTFGTVSPLVGARKNETCYYPLELPVGENDVLNALVKSGGLPPSSSNTDLVIYKKPIGTKATSQKAEPAAAGPGRIIHIPLRLRPGQSPPFKHEDVVLDDGDLVYVESPKPETFFTAGLLGTGEYPMPRDCELNVLDAITYVTGPLMNGFLDSASKITVLRKTASGEQLTIEIDPTMLLKDPTQRLNLHAGDILVVQEKPEAPDADDSPASNRKSAQMTIADVAALAKGGVSDEVIIHQMETTRSKFELTTKDILALKKYKVGDRLIIEMQDRRPDGP